MAERTEVAIVGAGFSGIAMAAKLRRAGRPEFVVLERSDELGGTWRDNSYPGCACDVPSHVYSFSFAPNPDWSATYAGQAEIQAYLRRVAEREGVLPHVRFGCDVEDASWDQAAGVWRLRAGGAEIEARALVAAAGPLSEPKLPQVPGLDLFAGEVFHSARWDHDYDLRGKRVAVIGTGASAIQFVPEIQPLVAQLHLFQRTPPWILPRTSRPLSDFERRLYRRLPAAQRAMREAVSFNREALALPMMRTWLSPAVRAVATAHRRRQVPDPALRAKLVPDYAPGCKRILVSSAYYPALGQPNVELIASGLAEVREGSVVGVDGSEREVDAILFGTGFDVTEPPIAARIQAGGRALAESWADDGMSALRGTTVAGFPNLFIMLGPNTILGHNSVVLMAEAQAEYALAAMGHVRRAGAVSAAPTAAAQARWNDEVHRRGLGTVWLDGGCSSWYLDRHGRNTTVWPGFSTSFRRELRRFDPAEYELASAPAAAPATA